MIGDLFMKVSEFILRIFPVVCEERLFTSGSFEGR